jgi:tRNA/tmRNA/rRNA uracil-C5-methylase (TrmA/RlmC/RlmD family)
VTRQFDTVVGVFLYPGDDDGHYYLGSRSRTRQPASKKIFGKSEIFQKSCGRSFLFSPLVFSQVNQSLAPELIGTAGTMLAPDRTARLFDLYCGYGLFSLCLADLVKAVTGVEISFHAVNAARANAERNNVRNARFVCSDITAASLPAVLQTLAGQDVVILDPPRAGTGPGVIECIAAKRPARVLHLFCEIDTLPAELNRWTAAGYKVTQARPFDMFPGTPTVEIAMVLEPV